MNSKTKKGGKGLITYVFVLFALAVLLLCALWIFLGRYDVNQEETEAESGVNKKLETFQTWLAGTTAESWTDLWREQHPESLDSREDVKAFMEKTFAAENVSCWRGSKSTADAPVYVIKNGDATLAEVTLGKNSDDSWQVTEVILKVTGDKEASVTAPVGCRVFCNGTELGEGYIAERNVDLFYLAEYADTRTDPQTWNTWKVTGLMAEPEFTAESPDSRTLGKIGENEFAFLCEDSLRTANIDNVEQFVKRLIHFFMNGSNLTAYNGKQALNYVREGTQAEELIRSVVRGVYLGTYFENYQLDYSVGPFIQWADNCIGCDVDYTVTNIDEDQSGTLRILLVDFGKGFEISGLGLE